MTDKPHTALITGGASGIGKAMALHLASQGWQVAILDIDEAALQEVAALSPQITPLPCDVTDAEAVRARIAEVESILGPVDRFMHCAAIMPGGILHEMTAEAITHVMQINYTGVVNCTQSMLPAMRQRNRGEFIVMGSIAGVVHQSKFGAYGTSKAATNFYMRVLMHENEGTAINFLLVCPSSVDTPLIQQAIDKGPAFLKGSKRFGTQVLTPDEIVDAIEHGLLRRKQVIYPGIAGTMRVLYLLFPRLSRMYSKSLS